MKRYLITLLLTIAGIAAQAQVQSNPRTLNTGRNIDQYGNQVDPSKQLNSLNDSVEIESLAPKLYQWRVDELLGTSTQIPVDTLELNYQNTSHLTEGETGHYNHLGNLGSPRLSHIFRDRLYTSETTLFLQPYSGFFFKRPSEMNFTNSNIPFTNLTYNKAGDKITGEDRFKAYFSANVNKRMAFGFNFDYLYGRGFYSNQGTSYYNGGIFASYKGNRYEMHAMYNNFYLKQNENGGITNDEYILHPENMAEGKKEYESNNIPVNFESTANRNHNATVFFTQRYKLGFDRVVFRPKEDQEAAKPTDSKNQGEAPEGTEDTAMTDSLSAPAAPALEMDTIYEYVPVTSFIHTVKVERSRHSFHSGDESRANYENSYFDSTASLDSTTAFSVRNTLGIALLEGFNKYAKAGLTAYISHKYSHYTLMNSDAELLNPKNETFNEQEVYVGGELAKRQGQALHYNVNGEIGIMDKASGQYRINGSADLNVPFMKDSLSLLVNARISNKLPDFYMRHYHSNHFMWDNDLDKEMRVRVDGELNMRATRTTLRVGLENIKNYAYFDANALPTQWDENIKVVDATLMQNFKLGILHLDNEVTWQKSDNEDVLPLPKLSLYHNLYILTKLAKKVLTMQLGADVRYFSKYYAPTYMPAIEQFHLQNLDDEENVRKIGGYPIVNVYANFQLKRTRFFIMMYHVNAGSGSKNYFLAPHYPINPRIIKFGLSWNFYD